jgi:hydrogenase nickel incorporation protein HypA/HybF
MHELSIAQGILDIIRENIPQGDGAKVKVVRLRIGAMAGVVPDSLDFCFSAITQGTPMERAALEIEHIPLTAHCLGCGKDSEIEPTLFACPLCGGLDLTVLTGRELQVREIEIDDMSGANS